MTTKEIVTTTIRLPRDLWLALRRLEEQGKIDSVQQAAIHSLWDLIERWAREIDDDSGGKEKTNKHENIKPGNDKDFQ